jgi:hypothetical protein
MAGLLPSPAVVEGIADPRHTAAEVMIVPMEMAHGGHGVLPVVAQEGPATLVGLVTRVDLLDARPMLLEEERRAAPVLTLLRPEAPVGRNGRRVRRV